MPRRRSETGWSHASEALDQRTDNSVVPGKPVEGLQINRKSEHPLDKQAGLFPHPRADSCCRFHGHDQRRFHPGRVLGDRQLHRVTIDSDDPAVVAVIPPVNGVLLSTSQTQAVRSNRNGGVAGRTTLARAIRQPYRRTPASPDDHMPRSSDGEYRAGAFHPACRSRTIRSGPLGNGQQDREVPKLQDCGGRRAR